MGIPNWTFEKDSPKYNFSKSVQWFTDLRRTDLVDKKSATELGYIIKSTKWVRIDLVDWFSDRFFVYKDTKKVEF